MENEFPTEKAWYIVQTVNGCEESAKRNIEQRVISMNIQEYVFQLLIPKVVIKVRNKKDEEIEKEEKLFPGYLFIEMIDNPSTWSVVRNTPMVTGFLGSSGGGTRPVPVRPDEMIRIFKQCGIKIEMDCKFKVDDQVEITSGPFVGQTAVVKEIDIEKQEVKIGITFMGQETVQNMRFDEVKPLA